LTNLDGNNDNVQVQLPSHKTPARNLTNTQIDYMMNARDRIDEIQRYHSGALQYDPKKYTSEQWSEYVNNLVKEPLYNKITAQGVTEDQLKQYQIEMANKSLNNFRKRYEAVDPTHPMVADSQAITGDYAFDNYQWENQKDYRNQRGLETTTIKGTNIPVMKNQLSAKDGGYTDKQKAQIKANRADMSQEFVERYRRKDAPVSGTLRVVHPGGNQVTRSFDSQGNYTDTETRVNTPAKKLTNAQWKAFATGTPVKQIENDMHNADMKNIGEVYNYFLQKGHIPTQMINNLKSGTAGYEGAVYFRQQQYNHMNKNNPALQKFNPYSNNYLYNQYRLPLLNYNFLTAGARNNKERAERLVNNVYGVNDLKQR
jgi:hypothetical protein